MKYFDFNKVEDFDDHILASIPNYDILVNAIKSISQFFAAEGSNIYDLGCSTGKLLKELDFDKKVTRFGYDISNLLPESDFDADLWFSAEDLNNNFRIENASIVYSIFTMQFLRPTGRTDFLKRIYDGLNDGGALIIAEKVYQEEGQVQEIFNFSHYDYKMKAFNSEEILGKERDLRFVMKPYRDDELERRLNWAGFDSVSVFWQMFNFKAYLAIKNERV